MKKYLHYFGLVAVTAIATTAFTSCSSDEEDFLDYAAQQSESPLSRAAATDNDITIGFEDYGNIPLAGPTSYGDNLYASYSGTKFTTGSITLENGNKINFGINNMGGYSFWNGGVALSNWAIMSNDDAPAGSASDWWYSYLNQCSVYNIYAGGNQEEAGADGSDVFAVVYGYQDDNNAAYTSLPQISFDNPVSLKSLEYCNSSYVYGVLQNGNQFGDSIIVNVPQLELSKGYFQVHILCYDENNNLIVEKTKYLADYQTGNTRVEPVAQWTLWDLTDSENNPIENVKTIKFNFSGSDNSDWGLNTPAYICIDNIKIAR